MADQSEQVVPNEEEEVAVNNGEEGQEEVENKTAEETTNEEATEENEGNEEGEEGEEGEKKKKKKKRYVSDDEDDEPKVIVIRKIPPSRPLPPPPPKVYDVDKTTWSTAPTSNRVWEVDAEEEYEEYEEPQEDFNEIFAESNFSSDYQFGNGDLGAGFFGVVKPVTKKDGNQKFVAKIVSNEKTGIVPRSFDSDYDILQKLNHKNIVKAFASYSSSTHSLVILEHCNGRDLTVAKKYSEKEVKKIGEQLFHAIAYVHDHKIVHGDIAPENVIVSEDSLEVKLIGFSCARELTKPLEHGQLIGNAEYQSPEILTRQGYTFSTDIWSLGCLLYYLVSGTSPFFDNSTIKMQSKIRSATFEFDASWNNISSDFKAFVTSLLQKSPSDRPTAQAVVSNPLWNN